MNSHRSVLTIASLAAVAALAISGCSSATKEKETTTGAAETTAATSMTTATSAVAAPAGLVGAGCAEYAKTVPSGPGSVEGLAKDPVATAASNSPVLTTLAGALSGKLNPDVNLVDTLNSGQYTVFAPTDEAFGKVDAETIEKLKADSKLLTSVLTYHVVSGQADPAAVVGEHKTLEGGSLTVSGSGENLMVNAAGVVCGGIKTANATLYLIDTVLMPPAAPAEPTSSEPATTPSP